MVKEKSRDAAVEKLSVLLHATQDFFILQALLAGLRGDDIQKILKVNKLRVSTISKYVQLAKKRKN